MKMKRAPHRGITRIFVLAVEHSSVLATANKLVARFPWVRVQTLPVDRDGVIDLGSAGGWRYARARAARWLAVMAANNETGVVQPIAEVSRLAREADSLLLIDAVPLPARSI